VSFAAGLDAFPLTVALELRDPFAQLALAPAIQLGRELGIAVNWLPIESQPLHPPSAPSAADDRGVRHRRHRAQMLAREIAVYAQAQGLAIEQPYRAAPADAARLAWLWMRAELPERLDVFLTDLFRRYWAEGLDAADRDAVAQVIVAAGGEADRFLAWAGSEGHATLTRIANDLRGAGIHGSPAYLAAGEVFLGRQHLPMIRWLLGGKRGPVPI
jgi:2-hydroxychromene-2-carboxylate isomerase